MYGWVCGVDVGVHAQRDRRLLAQPRRDALDGVAARSSLSTLKARMPTSSAYSISSSRLPTPEKTIFFGSAPTLSARKISPRDTVSTPAPSADERAQHRQVRVGLHRVADEVRCAGRARRRTRDSAAPASRGCRRRPACRPRRDLRQRHVFAVQLVAPVLESGASLLLCTARVRPLRSRPARDRAPVRRRRRADRPRAPASSTANSASSHVDVRRRRAHLGQRQLARARRRARSPRAPARPPPRAPARNGTPRADQPVGDLGRQQVALRRPRARMPLDVERRAGHQARHRARAQAAPSRPRRRAAPASPADPCCRRAAAP